MNIWIYLGILVVSEIVLAFLFSAISQIFYKKQGLDFKSILKGTVERVFLLVSLVNDYPHALTFFSALKLATRLKHNDSSADLENKFNDFYLMGNLISVMVAIGYVYLYHKLS
jgi:hypothetical protein